MKKRRHHFVWQYYLKAWTVAGRIACWRNGQVFRTDPTNVAVEKDFYRLRDISERDVATISAVAATAGMGHGSPFRSCHARSFMSTSS